MTAQEFNATEIGQTFWSSEGLHEPKQVTLLEKLPHCGICGGEPVDRVIHHERLHRTQLEAWKNIRWRCNVWLRNAEVKIRELEAYQSAKEVAV